MVKSKILFTLAAFAALVFIGGQLYASPVLIASPQRNGTAGRFGSEADDFMSVRNYVNLNFDKWFSAVSFFENRSIPDLLGVWSSFGGTDMAQLGFAVKLSDVYIGAYYGGNAYRSIGKIGSINDKNVTIYQYTEMEMPFFGNPAVMRVYDREPQFVTGEREIIYNEFALLLGIADMGFRLSLAGNYQIFSLDNFALNQSGNVSYYKSWQQELGKVNPELAWAFTKELLPGRGIKPEVKIDLIFNQDNLRDELYTAAGETNGVRVRKAQNHFNLGLFAGLGGFTIQQTGNFKWGFDFEYGANIYFFNNEYSYTDANGKNQIKKIKGELQNNGLLVEKSRNRHLITPSLNASWSGERIKLSGRFGFPVELDNLTETESALKSGDTSGAYVKHGTDKTTDTVVLAPALDLGLQWAVIPEKLFLNTGGAVTFGSVRMITVDQTLYSQGEVIPGASVATNTAFANAETQLRFGVTFNPIKHVGLQFTCGVNTGNNSINVFGTGSTGLFSFANVLATVKF